MKRMIVLLCVLVALIFASCQNEYGGATNCSDFDKNRQILKFMRDWYYWYETLDPSITYSTFDDPKELMSELRYKEGETLIDHFSYVTTKQSHDDYYAGKHYGIGYSKREDNGHYFVTLVLVGTPEEKAGLERSMELLAINGLTPPELYENQTWNSQHREDEDFEKTEKTDWNTPYKEENEGKKTIITVKKTNGENVDLEMTMTPSTVSSVLLSSIIDLNSKKVGYVAFKSFISSGPDDLSEVFSEFDEQEVEWLIIDLRYNGGGYLSVAEYLASLIKGDELSGELFIKLEFNNKHLDRNSSYHFKSLAHSLATKKVAFITTRGTASASESVISGLKPYVKEMAIIGSTTYGKPVGMTPAEICDLKVVPITFHVLNASHWGDYYYGMEPTCAATDDYKHNFGDIEEASLAEALYWLQNGKCSPQEAEIRSLSKQLPTIRPDINGVRTMYDMIAD